MLNSALRELRSSGTVVQVESKVFDLIDHLVANRERLLSKEELVTNLWNDRIVSDAAISSGSSAAIRVLGDNGNAQRFIRTLHGRGFRFSCGEMCEAADDASFSEQQSDAPISQRTNSVTVRTGHGSLVPLQVRVRRSYRPPTD